MRALGVTILALTAPAAAGRVTGKVTVTEADGAPATAADVIVYVVGFTEAGSPSTVAATITQRGKQFVPDLIAVTAGETVAFPNADPFLHNVFSQSPPRKFDLGSFKKGESKERAFPDLGVVDVYCNIHPEMAATILVLPNKKHTRAKPDGTFVLDDVPNGTWTVFAYTRRSTKPASTKVTVASGTDATVALALVRGGEPPHVNKYGEKYRSDAVTTYR